MASIGTTAITQSDLEREYRFGLFLNGQPLESAPDAATLAGARDRLIHQWLLEQEAEAEGIALADLTQQAEAVLEEIRNQYAGEEAFQSSLHRLGMNREEVLARLAAQERALRVVEQRLRPAAWVEPAEVEAYYHASFVPEFASRSEGEPPPLQAIETQIREILVQKRINELLTTWLEELKLARRVRIH